MSIWILLWGALSALLVGFAGWSFWLVYQQKQAWRSFSQKKKMQYRSGRLMETPQVEGRISGREFYLFPSEHAAPDGRSTRKLSAMEIVLKSDIPFNSALSSGGMMNVIDELAFADRYRPSNEKWNKLETSIRGQASKLLEAYYTDERLEALIPLIKIKNAWVLVLSFQGKGVLRIDIADPLESEKKITALAKKMMKVADILELKDGEREILLEGKAQIKPDAVLTADDAPVSLSLEDEVGEE